MLVCEITAEDVRLRGIQWHSDAGGVMEEGRGDGIGCIILSDGVGRLEWLL